MSGVVRGPLGGQLGLVVRAGGGLGLGLAVAVGGCVALVTAAVALAAARVTAKGIVGLTGEGSHLVLFGGLAGSPPSWVAWRVLFACLTGLGPVLEDLGDILAVAPTASSDASGASGASSEAATPAVSPGVTPSTACSWPCVAVTAPAPAPAPGIPERYFVSF